MAQNTIISLYPLNSMQNQISKPAGKLNNCHLLFPKRMIQIYCVVFMKTLLNGIWSLYLWKQYVHRKQTG